ncbi:MAG: hypothetical protein PUB17_09900 [Lachnospiraceae bacterium]|nr:hypothetical protein [Lachnospiraceae bacterium]
MRKCIAFTVMIITVLLAGCVRNDNTKSATYNISLETLGADETVDIDTYIERNTQVGDMYNLNRITGCTILAAAGCEGGDILIATCYDDDEGKSSIISFRKLTPWNVDAMETVAEYAVDRCSYPYVSIVSTDPLMFIFSSEKKNGAELVALSDNAIYTTGDGNGNVYKTANYVAYIDNTLLNLFELNNLENGIPVNKTYDLADDVNPGALSSYINICASDPEMDKIFVTADYTDVYEVNLRNLKVNYTYMTSGDEQRYYRNDYYLTIRTDNPVMVHKYSVNEDAYMGGYELGDMTYVVDSHYVITTNAGIGKTLKCIDVDDMTDCTSYNLMSNCYICDADYVPGTDAVILQMSQDLYVLWDVFDKYGDVEQ